MSSYVCYICEYAFFTLQSFRRHLCVHNSVGELRLPIHCRQEKCKSSFTRIYSFFRHLQTMHTITDIPCESTECEDQICIEDYPLIHNEQNIPAAPVSVSLLKNDIEQEAAILISSLKANSSIPYYVLPDVVQAVNSMCNMTVTYLKQEAECFLSSLESANESGKSNLLEKFDSLKNPLDFLSSEYKQRKYFTEHHCFIPPEEVVVGSRFEHRFDVQTGRVKYKLVPDVFQYIPLLKTLKMLCSRPDYVRAITECNTSRSGLLSHVTDGEKVTKSDFYSGENVLLLQLFYDGMATTNPLRGKQSIHNVGVFYFTVRNLPNSFTSCFCNIHLLALCHSQDLKRYGFTPVLERIVAGVKYLETNGIEVKVEGTPVTFRGSIFQVACDSLALNSLFGMIECFSADYFCTKCYATSQQIQEYFEEKDFTLRTVTEYNADLDEVGRGVAIHHKGIKTTCLLNDLSEFHILDNFCLDAMHILLEGLVPLEVGMILHQLVSVRKYFSFSYLNEQLITLFGRAVVDRKNRPNEITKLQGEHLPGQTASQNWALLRYLPQMVGQKVDKEDTFWELLLKLSELVDLVFAPKYTLGMVSYLRELIIEHHNLYKACFPDKTLKPKHHFLVHFPTIIQNCGPMVGMTCLRYELKNSFFKRSALPHIVCCFKDICKTLAYRHQFRSLSDTINGTFVRTSTYVPTTSSVLMCQLPAAEMLSDMFEMEQTSEVIICKKIEYCGTEYKCGNMLVVDIVEDIPVFCKLLQILFIKERWYFQVVEYRTDTFDNHSF